MKKDKILKYYNLWLTGVITIKEVSEKLSVSFQYVFKIFNKHKEQQEMDAEKFWNPEDEIK